MRITIIHRNEPVSGGRTRTKLMLEPAGDDLGLKMLTTKIRHGILTTRGDACYTKADDMRYAKDVLHRISKLKTGEIGFDAMYFGLVPDRFTRAMLRAVGAKQKR